MNTNTQELKPGQKSVATSYSHKAPFTAIFEDDGTHAYFYAGTDITKNEPKVEDAIHIYTVKDIIDPSQYSNIKIVWSDDGEKAALLINNYFEALFDFNQKKGFSKNLKTGPTGKWKRFKLYWSDDIVKEFPKEIFEQTNNLLSQTVKAVAEDNNESTRLRLFQILMNSTLIVPISEQESNPDHKFVTFPYEENGSILCTFTDHQTFIDNLGDQIEWKKTPVDYLFSIIEGYNISAVLITTSENKNILIDQKEYPLLAINKNQEGSSQQELLKSLSNMLIKPTGIDLNQPIYKKLITALKDYEDVKTAYLFQTTAKNATPILGIELKLRDERKLVKFYKSLVDLIKDNLNKDEAIELTVLEKGEYLHTAVKDKIEPFYVNITNELEPAFSDN